MMTVRQLILVPVFWGEWWVPARGNVYSWADVNGTMARVVAGRYLDGLNQYGVGRGALSKTHVHQVDPAPDGFGEADLQWMLRTAIAAGHLARPDEFDLQAQQPFYSLILQPGAERQPDESYQFDFTFDYGDGREPWTGPACWIRADVTAAGTVRRWAREIAEACTRGRGGIAERCQDGPPVFVDRVSVPQYWSVLDNACWPPPDVAPVERRSAHAVDHETQRRLDALFERQFQGAAQVEGPPGLHRREDDIP